jgi:YVTN family beta-propeller protein
VIETTGKTVLTTIKAEMARGPNGVAITPDGKHAYVANVNSNTVSVIDAASNTVVMGTGFPIPVGTGPIGVAVTPDGKHVYVANNLSANVSVIDTATNTVVGTPITMGNGPFLVGIIPPPAGVPFLAFSATLAIDLDSAPNEDRFELKSSFTLSSTASIDPVTEPVTLQIGTFTTTIPAGSFKKAGDGSFSFKGVIGDVSLEAHIKPTGTLRGARELDRDHEPGAGDADHRRRQRHDLGQAPHYRLKRMLTSVIRFK